MSEKFAVESPDYEALYEYERCRAPVRELCPRVTRHFLWEGWSQEHKVPIEWLEHYARCFHFSDAEIWAARIKEEFPSACGVYFLFDDEECIYVGQTYYFSTRAEQHRANRVAWTSHSYIEVPKFHAPAVEAYYIRRLEPALNTSIPRLRTYSDIVEKLGLDRAS